MFDFKLVETVEFLREHEPSEGYACNFSGGKDSIVMYDICKRHGIKLSGVHMAWTFIDPPELYQFIREHYPEVQRHYPKMTMWQGILKKGFPYRVKRWCCDELKKNPLKGLGGGKIVGIRAEESSRRANRPRIDYVRKSETLYKPIFYWSEGDIWSYIETHNLPYPSIYDEGFSRIGCVICPFLTGGRRIQHEKRWPEYWVKARQCGEVYFKRTSAENPDRENPLTLEQYLEWPEWTPQITNEYPLLEDIDADPPNYREGVCCMTCSHLDYLFDACKLHKYRLNGFYGLCDSHPALLKKAEND